MFADLADRLDYVFVDEAGQVCLANALIIAMSGRNLVLIGDQMQLGQPIQGVHPGRSGLSVLEYVLEDAATIPPERGVFLATTYRMHNDICRFISQAVYDGRLQPEAKNQNQCIVLSGSADPALRPTGINFIEVQHEGCSQRCEEEGAVIHRLYTNLLTQHYRDCEGKVHPIKPENIMVITPYNMQVNYLSSILPSGSRVGTVDKLQGQEAEIVLISMVTSSGEDLPRDLEFLYSKNRLNVAISRARIFACILANPRLLEVECNTVEQLKLVNTLCWAKEFSAAN
jgi:superfamily I DNA and/or RNA helicase